MSAEFRGDEFLYLVKVDEEDHRIFNQTDGSHDISADSIELNTKDRTASDYGNVTETISIDGVLTEDDPAVAYLKTAIRTKQLVTITEVNTRDLTTETGLYKLDSFNKTSSNEDFAMYSIGATLSSTISEGTLTEVPEGAPDPTEEPEEPPVVEG